MNLTASLPVLALLLLSCTSNKTADKDQTNKEENAVKIDTAIKIVVQDTVKAPDTNRIGNLYLGMKGKEVITILGEPSSKSKAEGWGADGLVHQDWNFSGKGIALNLSQEDKNKEMEVFSIMVTAPYKEQTDQKIGIGSLYNDVMKAYEKHIDKTASDATMIIVGSVYGGMIFNFKSNKVEKIFIGAAAE